ncbi:MAG: beta-ketoacyl synthase N-terminal-like domain-containing protein [Robiginitalea sp.]|nr:beta-ketoacyl synthase N-terminal-like domain-containing protein [Robiginitalea sp.]
MFREPIAIRSIASLSPLGLGTEATWEGYLRPSHALSRPEKGPMAGEFMGELPDSASAEVKELQASHGAYKNLDKSVLYAMAVCREATKQAGWGPGSRYGINLGSSRGATGLFEKYHGEFMEAGRVGTQASPSTTLGNIASWVAQDLRSEGPELSHSITCSTALHALLNGVAWLRSGMARTFLVGGSEAPLTPFTIAQMKALKIYSREKGAYPCRALDLEKASNTMVLGEGAGAVCLEIGRSDQALAFIEGMGWATETLQHGASLSAEARCLQRSMAMAMQGVSPRQVDAVVMHAPGTVKGDRAEFRAIQRVFEGKPPALTTNKWKIGHTLGASGLLSLEMAVLMLQKQEFIGVPYLTGPRVPAQLRYILVNAVGFGGNAVSILLSRP